MTSNPARLRWLIRLDDEEEHEETGSNRNGSRNSSTTDGDLLAALRSLPPRPQEEEEGSVNAGGGGGDSSHLPPLPITRSYARPLDRRRALASCLAQHAAVCAGLGFEWGRSPGISRTLRGGKPFVARRRKVETAADEGGAGGGGAHSSAAAAPNFNFNVSHDGPWLALAAEPLLLVGVDVCSPRVIGGGAGAGGGERGGAGRTEDDANRASRPALSPPSPALGAARLRSSLGSALSDPEWSRVALEPEAASQDALFRKFWALREAWSKARGDGLGAADLARAEFSIGASGSGESGGNGESGDGDEEEEKHLSPSPRISLRLDGALQDQWSFELHDLSDGTALAVALGPPSAAVDAGGTFLETLGRPSMTRAEVEGAQRECRRRFLSREEAAAAEAGRSRSSSSSWRRMNLRELIEEAEVWKKGGNKERENMEKKKKKEGGEIEI